MENILKLLSILLFGILQNFTAHPAQTRASIQPLAAVEIDGKWGFVNAKGQYVFDQRFEKASTFSEGLAAVKIDGTWGYIDQTGRIVIPPQFEEADHFAEGLARVTLGGKDGFIDQTGAVVIQPQFDRAWSFSCGLGMVEVSHKRGYIDKGGRVAIAPQFESADSFSEGFAYASTGDKRGYIDRTGNMITNMQIGERAGFFSEGMAAVQVSGKWGYIDKSGAIIIPPEFDYAFDFSEELAAAGHSPNYNFIDSTGRVVVALRYPTSSGCESLKFSEGLAIAEVAGKCTLIDHSGAVLARSPLKPLETFVTPFSQGMARFMATGSAKWGYLDRAGTVAIPARFNSATDFSQPTKSWSPYHCR